MNILGIETAKLPSPSAQGAIPILVLLVLVMMLVPLPAVLLDVLFTFNIALSIIVLFTAINIKTFKDFVAFPTVFTAHHPLTPIVKRCIDSRGLNGGS